jgi:hypothetical protein
MHRLVQMTNPTKEPAMPTTDPQLDVRTEPPARRHELIFDTYEPDAGFVLVSDHDPSRSTTSSPPSTPASSAGTTSSGPARRAGAHRVSRPLPVCSTPADRSWLSRMPAC